MKVYELKFNRDFLGVYRISAVESPAVESNLIKFSKEEEKKVYFSNDDKQIFYSIAMIPNKLIFRSDVKGEPANVFYTENTVKLLQENYFRLNANKNTNIEHKDENEQGIFPFESWIVEDPEKDKATLMGLEVQKGYWIMAYKVDSPEVWKKVKSGEINGLSIEAHLDFEEKSKTQITMNKKTFWPTWAGAIKKVAMASERMEVKVGDKSYFVTDLNEGSIVTDKDGNPIPDSEFEYEGKKYSTDEMGAIMPMAAEEPPTEEPPVEEEPPTEEPPADDTEGLKKENSDLKDEVAKLKEELSKMEADKVKAETNLTNMAKHTMSAKPIPLTPDPVTKTYDQMSNFEKLKFNRENPKL